MSILKRALVLLPIAVGCAASKPQQPGLTPMAIQRPKPVVEDHFKGDASHRIEEAHLREILAAPVFLEARARVGVVPVTSQYGPDEEVPLSPALAPLSSALEDSAAFDVVTEVSTVWPATRGVAGLRELAARYRAEYLLLYRHRFVDTTGANGWAAFYPTLIGAFFVPARTLRVAGVVEATLFDVKSGTILFTTFERVEGSEEVNVWENDRKVASLRKQLVEEAAQRLSSKVSEQVGALQKEPVTGSVTWTTPNSSTSTAAASTKRSG